ncbi:hypothetical protein ASPVEDRAFT_220021 [Aspergillus versicolor CBS 583.65]|uniref:Zn(2)-C6 fungal-type domain-containing protein n=1 Tax=Aspergillus versicolor CBS 583.65 TaxID=1036611 RepID=A0A1L9P3R7_ASPVE|nr:uncharacterized protein ASPVEDRAFT_220021 [Aspergillus versicolor CBS 583.65]OJI96138.1 hypothetical protein ASPVEDRAFT_220021 [Aspergillus versicolor CBS 583.65]
MFRTPPAGGPVHPPQKGRVLDSDLPSQDIRQQTRTPNSRARQMQSGVERSDSSEQLVRRRRPRCSRACEPCRIRKVRCIAGVNGSLPCERCRTMDVKCVIRQRFVQSAYRVNNSSRRPSRSLDEHADPFLMTASDIFPSMESRQTLVSPPDDLVFKSSPSHQDPRDELHPQDLGSGLGPTCEESIRTPESAPEIASHPHLHPHSSTQPRPSDTSAQTSRATRDILARLDSEILALSSATLRQSLIRHLMSQVRILINTIRQIERLGPVGAITDPSRRYWGPTSQRHGIWADAVENDSDRRCRNPDNSHPWPPSIGSHKTEGFLSQSDPGYGLGAVGPDGSRDGPDLGTTSVEPARPESTSSAGDDAARLESGIRDLLDEFLDPIPLPVSGPVSSQPKLGRGGYGASAPNVELDVELDFWS